MADNTASFKLEVDDSQVERAMLDLAKSVEKNQTSFDELSESGTAALKDITTAAEKGEAEIKQYNNQLEHTAAAAKKAEQESGRFSRGLKSLFGNISIGGGIS